MSTHSPHIEPCPNIIDGSSFKNATDEKKPRTLISAISGTERPGFRKVHFPHRIAASLDSLRRGKFISQKKHFGIVSADNSKRRKDEQGYPPCHGRN